MQETLRPRFGSRRLAVAGGRTTRTGPSAFGPSTDALTAWRTWRSTLSANPSAGNDTARTYGGLLLRFLAETGAQNPADYTEEDIHDFLNAFAPRGRTKYAYAKALRSFFRWTLRKGITAADPMEAVELRKPRRVPPITLTLEELQRLLVAAVFTPAGPQTPAGHGERVAWGILLVYSLGLRRMEAEGLKWEHIRDTEDGPVIEIHTTKGDDERPALPLSPLAIECLYWLRRLPVRKTQFGPEYILRVSRHTLSSWVHEAGVAAGLPARKVGAHRLRASLATHLLRGNVDVGIVQQILGHRDLSSTAWYLGQAEEAQVRAALGRTWQSDERSLENLSEPAASTALLSLTGQERAILRLLGRELSNREIATELGMALSTVELHVSDIYAKIGVTGRGAGRASAAALARAAGLVSIGGQR